MKLTSLTTRALAVVALTASLITVGQLPGSPVKIANASLSLTDASQPRRINGGDGFMCMEAMSAIACSGLNSDGQLGDGTTTSRSHLKQLPGTNIMNPQQLAVGKAHACAVSGSNSTGGQGKLYCWGDNQYGQLGDNSTTDRSTPTLVADNGAFVNASVQNVIAGDNHTCAITVVSTINRMFCWGLNNKGQLGDGTTANKSVPTAVAGIFATSGVYTTGQYYLAQAAAGAEHTCAANTNTNPTVIYCWGENGNGQLGNGSTTDSSTPVSTGSNGTAAGGSYTSFLTAGADFSCALDQGSVKCWGANAMGQMGNGGNTDVTSPTTIPNSGSFVNSTYQTVVAGGKTACAIKAASSNNHIWCWGANTAGQIGDGTTTTRTVPVLVANNSAQGFTNGTLGTFGSDYTGLAVARSVTNGFACVTYWCWGNNTNGELAQGNTTNVVAPSKVKSGSIVADDVTGATVTAAFTGSTVVVTFSGLPASTVTLARVTVAPKTHALLPNQSAAIGQKSYMSKMFSGSSLPVVTNGGFSLTVPSLNTMINSQSGPGTMSNESFSASTAYHLTYDITGLAATGYPDGWRLRPTQTAGQELVVGGTSNTSSSSAATTAPAASTPAVSTPAASATPSYANAIPGVTVTDPKVYTTAAPTKVAGDSAISVLTPAQAKTQDIVSKTPSVCLPNDEDLVFLDEGRCIAEVVNVKTRKVLRTLKTTVVDDDIADLQVGNEIAVLSPLYFYAGTTTFKPSSIARLNTLKTQILSAGSVLVAGHSGILMGNTPENVALSKQRAQAAVKALKSRGSKGPFAIAAVGALDPATTKQTPAAQDKNRRVVIVLIP